MIKRKFPPRFNDVPYQRLNVPSSEKHNSKDTGYKDRADFGYDAGFPPYTRGPYGSMYLGRPWTIRQYSGFSTVQESNLFYRRNIAAGQRGLSLAFDLPTHRGYDSTHPRVMGDVGSAGVAIDSVEDMKLLFDQIDLGQISVSMTMNGAVLPIMAFYIVTAQEQGVAIENLRGTIQNDILKEFLVRNTYIYPPTPSMRIIGDIFAYCSQNMPHYNAISVSGYHIHEAGAPADMELAFTLSNALAYVRTAIDCGLKIDDIAPRMSFFWAIGMDFTTGIAKMRAGRLLWAALMKMFDPKNPRSLCLRTHCQTSGWSLTAQQPYNNVIRTSLEGLAAVIGGTQSLHTNSLDEALALPTPFSARIARETQLILQHETGLTSTIDPFGGSHYIEHLTMKLANDAWKTMIEIEEMGGMSSAIESGLLKMKITDVATRRQAKIDNKEEAIIGVNCYQKDEQDKERVDILDIDPKAVLEQQKKQLERLYHSRNHKQVEISLQRIRHYAQSGKGNLLEASILAAKERATLGEISQALEDVFGRYEQTSRLVTNVYGSNRYSHDSLQLVHQKVEQFENETGRRPRILMTKIGQDGHDRGLYVVASTFADAGFDVDIGTMFPTAEEVARHAIEQDVHIIGVSSLSAGHKVLIPQLIECLEGYKRKDILVVLGGIVPKADQEVLLKKGVTAIIGPWSANSYFGSYDYGLVIISKRRWLLGRIIV